MCHLHILSNDVRYCNSQINQEISDLMHVNNFGKSSTSQWIFAFDSWDVITVR